MGKIVNSKSKGIPHATMDEDFLTHKNCSEWWYATGYLTDEANNLFTYQFTLAKIKIYGIKFHVILSVLTDFNNNIHKYFQKVAFLGKNITTTESQTSFGNIASMTFKPNKFGSKGKMTVDMKRDDYAVSLELNAVKPPVWHCEEGILKMGLINDPEEKTYYYSYTNLQTKGVITIEGKEYRVTGKSWFDRQGGTYHITKPQVNWEWFSLRFFDNSEIMLFSFPHQSYGDGTKIEEDGKYSRLNNYTVTPHKFVTAGPNYKFSSGWDIFLPAVKEERYTLTPIMDGQFNLFFFEQLAEIRNVKKELVGYAIVELLPGVYNKKLKSSMIFKKTK